MMPSVPSTMTARFGHLDDAAADVADADPRARTDQFREASHRHQILDEADAADRQRDADARNERDDDANERVEDPADVDADEIERHDDREEQHDGIGRAPDQVFAAGADDAGAAADQILPATPSR